MLKSIDTAYINFLGRWTSWVTAKPWSVILVALSLTLGSLLYLSQNIAIDTSTGDMLSDELDFRKFNSEMDAAFPQFSDTLLVVIEGHSIDLADAAALKLATALRANPKLFGEIYDLEGEDFFRTNGLLYLDLDELYELSDKLAEAQPFLASLWQDPSIRGLFGILGKAINSNGQAGVGAPLEISPFLDRISEIAEAQIQGEFSQLSWRQLMRGNDSGVHANRRFLLIQPALDFGSLQPASDAMDGVRERVNTLQLTLENGLRVRLSGPVALEQEELESVEQGMGLAGIISFILVMGLLIIGLRRSWLVVCCLITLLMGLVWTGAFAIFALGSLNLISVAFAVLFIGLSVDFGIHYALRYLEGVSDELGTVKALTDAAKGVGGALTLSAIGAAIAFYSFLPTDYNGLAELGLIAGTGMFIAFIANMTLLPALLALRPISSLSSIRPRTHPTASPVRRLLIKRARPITWGFVIVAVLAISAVPQVVFDFDPLNLKNRQTESMSTLIDLMADKRTSPYTIDVLAKDLESGQALAARLAKLDEVDNAETIADYVPNNQDEKLDIIATTALFLLPAFSTERLAAPTKHDRQTAILEFISKLNAAHTSPMAKSATRLAELLSKLDASGAGELEHRLLAHLPAQLKTLKASLNAAPVTLADLPESLKSRKIAMDGRVKIEVFPKYDVTDRKRLTEFVDAARTLAPKAIGSPVVILEAGRAILGAFYQAGALSVALIAILLVIVLGRVRDTLLVFAPLLLAGIFTLAASALLGLAFNFANVIVLPLLFGLGVAGGIHLVSRARKSETSEQHIKSSTPRAILFSALTTIGSFGSIALSAHPGTASMGLLLTIAITMTLLCTLIFLPALMAYGRPRQPTDL